MRIDAPPAPALQATELTVERLARAESAALNKSETGIPYCDNLDERELTASSFKRAPCGAPTLRIEEGAP